MMKQVFGGSWGDPQETDFYQKYRTAVRYGKAGDIMGRFSTSLKRNEVVQSFFLLFLLLFLHLFLLL
jgi:hypothetical protein